MHIWPLAVTYIYCQVSIVFVAGSLLYQSSPKQIKICMFEITSEACVWFQMASWVTLPVVVRHKQLSLGTRWWRHNCVRNTYYSTKPNAIWFPVTLTDTSEYLRNSGKMSYEWKFQNTVTESVLKGTRWYHLFSAPKHVSSWGLRKFVHKGF